MILVLIGLILTMAGVGSLDFSDVDIAYSVVVSIFGLSTMYLGVKNAEV